MLRLSFSRLTLLVEWQETDLASACVSWAALVNVLCSCRNLVGGWFVGSVASDLWIKGLRFNSRPFFFHVTTLGKLFTHLCLCHHSPGSIINTGQGAVTPYHWEGNRRSGFSLAMHHRLQWFIHLWAHGLRKGDKHPAYTPLRVMVHFTFTCSVFCCIICYVAVVGSSSDVSGFGLDGSSVDKSRNSFRFVRVVLFVPSVLWRCLLGCRKGIQPVKNWVVGCWHGYLSGAKCRLAYGPADATATHCLVLQ